MSLPEWPDRGCDMCRADPDWSCAMCRDYELNRADAAIARLKVAVEAMTVSLQADGKMLPSTTYARLEATLHDIGEIPP